VIWSDVAVIDDSITQCMHDRPFVRRTSGCATLPVLHVDCGLRKAETISR
jgi:hypothetical protein